MATNSVAVVSASDDGMMTLGCNKELNNGMHAVVYSCALPPCSAMVNTSKIVRSCVVYVGAIVAGSRKTSDKDAFSATPCMDIVGGCVPGGLSTGGNTFF